MLSIGKLGSTSGEYYLAVVAAGVEDYYLREGEAPGRWLSDGGLDLFGEVEPDDLRALLAGRDPHTDEQLVAGPAGGRARTPGFDLTFSAPKSVSLLYGLGDPQLQAEAIEAHERAVGAAIGYLEEHAAHLRRGRNGAQRVGAVGLVAAGFRHRASRAGDPALHTHVLVANVGKDHEGRYGALDSRAIYRSARTAGYLYQAELRHQLTTSLGVQWEPVVKGAAEIKGVPREVIDAFSQRRAEIVERLAERGQTSRRAAEVAALDTRPPKQATLGRDLFADWAARAAELGFGAHELEATLWRSHEREPEPREIEGVWEQLAAPEGLTAHESTFTRAEVLRELCARAGPGWGADALGAAADSFLESDRAVLLAPDEPYAPARYCTPELLGTERELLGIAIDRQAEGAGLVDDPITEAVIAARPTLSQEQEAMVRGLLGSGDGLEVVIGHAGAGKTYALEPAREAWQAEGYRVIGAALSARAASELQAGSGIPSQTLASLLTDCRDAERTPLSPMSVCVVDEAGMVGTRDLAELARHADEAGAKLVLVGDPAQLPEISAGGAFAALAQSLGALELETNRRQELGWERDALQAIRDGRSTEAVDAYVEHGRIHVEADPIDARAALVADWLAAHRSGAEALMISARLDDAAQLSRAARVELVRAGEVGGPERYLACGPVSAGDRVMALRNDPALGVQNGMRGTVLGLGVDGGLRVVSDRGAIVQLPRQYLEAGNLTYGYAVTAHKAQGMTVERAFVLGSGGIDRQWGYTALSRAQVESHLYLAADERTRIFDRSEVGGRDEPTRESALERLARDLERDGSQELASWRTVERELPERGRGIELEL